MRKQNWLRAKFWHLSWNIFKENVNVWEEYFPYNEFAYNKVPYSSIFFYAFDMDCDFNPLTPFDLLHLPIYNDLLHKDT